MAEIHVAERDRKLKISYEEAQELEWEGLQLVACLYGEKSSTPSSLEQGGPPIGDWLPPLRAATNI